MLYAVKHKKTCKFALCSFINIFHGHWERAGYRKYVGAHEDDFVVHRDVNILATHEKDTYIGS